MLPPTAREVVSNGAMYEMSAGSPLWGDPAFSHFDSRDMGTALTAHCSFFLSHFSVCFAAKIVTSIFLPSFHVLLQVFVTTQAVLIFVLSRNN